MLLGGLAHAVLISHIVGEPTVWRLMTWGLVWAAVCFAPLVRPGPVRAALVIGPALCAMFGGVALALLCSVLISVTRRGALDAPKLRAGAALEVFCVALIGGPLTAVLLTPLRIDAHHLFERVEVFDVSRFQRILITRTPTATRLWLDGNRQLSSDDERQYHEALVRPVMSHRPARVLILGGGDGLAAREVLLHDFVTALTLVELDARVPALVRRSSLGPLTGDTFEDPRLELIEADALAWLDENPRLFDAVIVDFPDPTTPALSNLFAVRTWERVRAHLAPGGRCTIQSCTLLLPHVVADIAKNVTAGGLTPEVYSREIPSFGSNAFILARAGGEPVEAKLHAPAQTLVTDAALRGLLSMK